MLYTREKLEEYSNPLSDTENEKCKNSIKMVKDALVSAGYSLDEDLKQYDDYTFYYETRDKYGNRITVLLQGSYANKTNIKHTSDVDVAVIYKPFFPLAFSLYKDRITKALKNYFGNDAERKNKSITVHGNTNRKDIDVVPAYSDENIANGINFYTDAGERIINYPLQHISNATSKNKNTSSMYKKYVRILKNIKHDMEETKSSARNVGSFQLESLLWNLPNNYFSTYTYSYNKGVKDIIGYIYNHINEIRNYKEGNGIKALVISEDVYNKLRAFVTDLYYFYSCEV